MSLGNWFLQQVTLVAQLGLTGFLAALGVWSGGVWCVALAAAAFICYARVCWVHARFSFSYLVWLAFLLAVLVGLAGS